VKSYRISKKEVDSSRLNAEKQFADAIDVLKEQNYKEENILELLKRLVAEKQLTDAIDVLKKQNYKENILSLVEKPKDGIPIVIFSNDELSCLETIVKFLKENKYLSFSEIASLLNRDPRTIWATYSNSRKKKSGLFLIKDCEYYIPFEIFRNRSLGVLENICVYLKDVCKLSFHQIAVLLRRDDRTVWTSYNKARGKYKQ